MGNLVIFQLLAGESDVWTAPMCPGRLRESSAFFCAGAAVESRAVWPKPERNPEP